MGAPASTEKQLQALTDPAGNLRVALQAGVPVNIVVGDVGILDGGDVTQGAKADGAWDGAAASATTVAIYKAQYAKLAALSAILQTIGQATPSSGAVVGGNDANSLFQALQIGVYGEVQVGLASQLDYMVNDSVAAVLSDGYPTQQKAFWASSSTITVPLHPAVSVSGNPTGTIAPQLGGAGMPNLAPIRSGRFTISNSTDKTMTGFTLVFSATVDSAAVSKTYTYPFALTQVAGAQAEYFMPIHSVGIYNTVSMICTFASPPTTTAKYVQVQCIWGFTPIESWPKEWQFDTTINITDNVSHDVVAAPASGCRLVLEEFFAVNSSTTTASDVTLTEGSGGTTRSKGMVYANGLGWRRGPAPVGRGMKWPAATAVSVIAAASVGSPGINCNAIGHYEAI